MNIKQTMRNLVLGVLLVVGITITVTPLTVNAVSTCGGTETSLISCGDNDKDNNNDGVVDHKDNGIWSLLIIVINLLSVGVGILALAGILYGAILYTSAGGNSEQVKKAMGMFTNVVIGIVAFAGMWALLNFLIPGGVLNSL